MDTSSGWGGFSPVAEFALATIAAVLLVALANNAPSVGKPLVAVVALGMAYSAVRETGA